jgi:DNA-binding protein Fis
MVAGAREGILSVGADQQLPLRDVERAYILMVLDQTGGNKSRAAEILGLDRKTLYRKLEEFGYPDRPAP